MIKQQGMAFMMEPLFMLSSLRIANLKMMVKLKSLTVVCTPNRLPLAPSNQCDYTNQKPLSGYRPEAL